MKSQLELIKTEMVRHRSDTRGVVVTEIQTIRNPETGEETTVRFWRDFETQRLMRVELV